MQAVYSKLRLLEFTRDDAPRIQRKKRVEGGRAIAKSPGATDRQRSRTDGRNSSVEKRQLPFLKEKTPFRRRRQWRAHGNSKISRVITC